MKVKKKNGKIETFDPEKIIDAVTKSAVRIRDYVNVNPSELLTADEKKKILKEVNKEIKKLNKNLIKTEEIHQIVIKTLNKVCPDVGNVYNDFHNYKVKIAEEYAKINSSIDNMVNNGDKTNANSDSLLVATQNNLEACIVEKSRFENYFLTSIENELINAGFIYCHDKDHRMLYPYNCSIFNIQNLIDNHIEINGVSYTEPKRVSSWFGIIKDLFLSATASQYGGFTVARFDNLIGQQAKKYEISLRNKIGKEFDTMVKNYGIKNTPETKEKYVSEKVEEIITSEIREGIQGLEYSLNTVSSSRGDFPFTAITIGNSFYDNKWTKIACLEILKRRRQGIGYLNKPAIFPKLIFLYDETLHGEGAPFNDVFEEAIKTSTVAMMPDYSSNTGYGGMSDIYCKFNGIERTFDKTGRIVTEAKIADGWNDGRLVPLDDPRRKEGKWSHGHPDLAVSPMGCRSYLSPAYYHRDVDTKEPIAPYDVNVLPDGFKVIKTKSKFTRVADENGHIFATEFDDFMYPYNDEEIPVYEGRQNNGVISLNLPMIYERTKLDKKDFFEFLDYNLQIIRNLHIRSILFNSTKKASINPYAFQYGGLLDEFGNIARLKNGEEIRTILKKGTASFGITGLNELQILYNKRTIVEEWNKTGKLEFLNKVIDHIQKKIDEFKDVDNIAYSIYGTPAENLSGVQYNQFKKMFPRVCTDNFKNIWFSNSFHIDVTEDPGSPYIKQDIEFGLFHKFTGGHIQYCRVGNSKNVNAIHNIVKRGVGMGFYQGVNMDLSFCDDCGWAFDSRNLTINECPKCGSKSITTIARLCGYSGYVRRGSFSDGVSDSGCRVNNSLKENIKSRVSM